MNRRCFCKYCSVQQEHYFFSLLGINGQENKTLHREPRHKDIEKCLVRKFPDPIQSFKTPGTALCLCSHHADHRELVAEMENHSIKPLKCYFGYVTFSLKILTGSPLLTLCY